MGFRITSLAFADGASIPRRHTCDGENLSPPLTWFDVPDGTRSFALIMDDPDAPHGNFTHWVVFDIPGDTRELGEMRPGGSIGREARTSSGRAEYSGPCPPPGDAAHRYRFTLYALDVASLDLSGINTTRDHVEQALEGRALATARLIGTYQRQPAPAGSRR
jgi:Raf kinase inhibitor-like YbhB/YbcL family protein